MPEYINWFIKPGIARPGTPLFKVSGITLHEEYGERRGHGAKYFAKLLRNSAKTRTRLSTHYFVDDDVVVCTIPENEVALHANDFADNETVSVTMCVYESCDYEKLLQNTKDLAVQIFKRAGIKFVGDKIFTHKQFSNYSQDCPHIFISQNRFAEFARDVQEAIVDTETFDIPDIQTDIFEDDTKDTIVQQAFSSNPEMEDIYTTDDAGENILEAIPTPQEEMMLYSTYPTSSDEAEDPDMEDLFPYMGLDTK